METKTGTITGVETKMSKNGKPYYTITIDKLRFNTFSSEMAKYSPGTFVSYSTEKNAQGFNSLLNMSETTKPLVTSSTTSPTFSSGSGSFHLTPEACRSNALNSAIETFKTRKDVDTATQREFWNMVINYEIYIFEGEIPDFNEEEESEK